MWILFVLQCIEAHKWTLSFLYQIRTVVKIWFSFHVRMENDKYEWYGWYDKENK